MLRNTLCCKGHNVVNATSVPCSHPLLPQYSLKALSSHRTPTHRRPYVTFECLPITLEIFCGILIERIRSIGFEEQKLWLRQLPTPNHYHHHIASQTDLHAYYNRVQVQYRLPIFPQNIQTHVPLEVNVRVVDLLRALYFRGIVRKVLVDGEAEVEGAALVHSFVRLDGEDKVEDVVRVWEVGFHGGPKREL